VFVLLTTRQTINPHSELYGGRPKKTKYETQVLDNTPKRAGHS